MGLSGGSMQNGGSSSSGGSASGPVGGDLAGNLPNPTVAKIAGVAVSGTPASGQVPTATGTTAATWQQTTLPVTVDGTAQTARHTIHFSSSRHVSAIPFDDGTAIHINLDHPVAEPAIGTGRIQFGATIGAQVNQTENFGHQLYVLQSNMSTAGSDFTNAAAEVTQNNAIRAANGPQCKVLLYKATVDRNASGDPNGNTTWTRHSQNTTQMFLYDNTGAVVIQFGSNHNTDPQMDWGSTAYQVAAVQRVIQQCLQGGWDGAFCDNLFPAALSLPAGTPIYSVNMPTSNGGTLDSDANFNAAVRSFITYASQEFAKNGLILMGNAGGTLTQTGGAAGTPTDVVGAYKSYFDAGLTGLLDESFVSVFTNGTTAFNPPTMNGGPNNADGTPVCTNTLQLMSYIKPPKFIMTHSYVQGGPYITPTNANAFYFSVVASLLGGNGNVIYCIDNCNDAVSGGYATGRLNTPWQPFLWRAQQLGRPLGTWSNNSGANGQLSTTAGVYIRYFQNGIAIWNNTNGTLTEPTTGAVVAGHASDIILYRHSKQILTYSATMTLMDPAFAKYQRTVASNGTAFTINPPTSTPTGFDCQEFSLEIHNGSGGALGAVTFNGALWGNTASWVQPANTKSRTGLFQWNGTVWVLVSITPDW